MFKPIVGSVVGPTSSTHWGQVLTSPEAYGVVELAFADGGARAAGVHLLSVLSRKLSDNPASLKFLEQIADELAGEGTRTIILCVPVGPVVYIVLRGAGDVYLKRGREFARLLTGAGAVSGEVKAGDTILLVSEGFSRTLVPDEVKNVFDHLTPGEVAEQLTLMLHEKKDGEGSAALILQMNDSGDLPEEISAVSVPARAAVSPMNAVFARLHPRSIAGVRRHITRANVKRAIAHARNNPKKVTAIALVVLLTLFGTSVLLGIWKQSTRGKNQAVIAALSDAKHSLDEGIALLPLNGAKGRQRLVAAKEILEPLRTTVSARSVEGIQVANMYREITDNLTSAMQINRVTPELFFDVGLVKKDGKASFIGGEDLTMGIVDQATTTVYALNVATKKASVLGGGQPYEGISYVAVHGDKVYVLTSTGVHMVRLSDKQTVRDVVKKDAQWGTIHSLVSFGGNLYLLDTQKSRVWKYVATETGFSDIHEYLNPDTLPDFSMAANMAIDGSVWVGSANGKIQKFTQGREDTFIPQGVDPPFGQTLIIYTSDNTANLYILDSQNKRVVVLDKDGLYLSQYVWEIDLNPTDLTVSESERKLFLLAAGALYWVPLK